MSFKRMIQMSSKELKDSLFSLYDEYNHTTKTSKAFCRNSSIVNNDTNNQNDDERSSSMATCLRKTDDWKVISLFLSFIFIIC